MTRFEKLKLKAARRKLRVAMVVSATSDTKMTHPYVADAYKILDDLLNDQYTKGYKFGYILFDKFTKRR